MPSLPVLAKALKINGVVQGVGFRPFLFGLAATHGLTGRVSNTAQGVDLVIEGPGPALEAFVRDITDKPPLLSRISEVRSETIGVKGYEDFQIVKSQDADSKFTLISPDVCVCSDCLAELRNPSDRRFEYPFINCTNCGPRYTIIRDIPYDRPKTSMKDFRMCPECSSEYADPSDRRFHAQPNACPVCGPRVWLTDSSGKKASGSPGEAVDEAAALLKKGRILAVKGLGGFHIAVDASNEDAVALLRRRKQRPHKPFALMAAGESALFDHVHTDSGSLELLGSYHRPIVLFEKRQEAAAGMLAPSIAPNNTCLGIMLPYTPLHYLLLDKGPDILVMTSGNRSGEPLSIDNADALDAFAHIADYFLLHDRDIYFRADDSIARVQKEQSRFIRRSRGYAPLPVDLEPFSGAGLPRILGCGAGLKSTVCLTRDRYGFLSQHIGDLENPRVHEFYDQTIGHMKKIMDIEPELIVHDMHPGYYSTRYARGLNGTLPRVAVQHHHAHALSCMAENRLGCTETNRLESPVLALTLDGTGYGTDGRIWGGEILSCTYTDFERRARLGYIPMPGGDAAVLAPWRVAAALLYKTFGPAFTDLDIPWCKAMDADKLTFLIQMMDRKLNSPLTSSAGRMFDAVASLLCIRHEISHESQAAMELEAAAAGISDAASYGFDIRKDKDGCRILDLGPGVKELVDDIQDRQPAALISARFHATLTGLFVRAAAEICSETGIQEAVLSGGVFNNDRILSATVDGLEAEGITVYTHSRVPCGDGGIALGQVMAGAALTAAGRIQNPDII